jgi:hypothetical protein
MFRRLYFLFPNAALTQAAVDELYQLGIKPRRIHAMSHEGMSMPFLLQATDKQKHDDVHHIEDFLWLTNIILFFVAFAVFIYSAAAGELFFTIVCLSIMLVTFIAGDFFALYIPHIHLSEFKHAINHNEILLMVDMPKSQVLKIESCIHRHHPAAIEGGSSWSLQYMGL